MGYRYLSLCLVLLALPFFPVRASVEGLVPTADELSRAPLVLRAWADRKLSPTEWFFSDVRSLGRFGWGPVLPRHIIGWWTIEPPDARRRQARVFFPPAPKNAPVLKPSGTFVLLAEDNFHLLAAYASSDDPRECLPGMTLEQFEQRAYDARLVRQTTETFFRAMRERQWDLAAAQLAEPLRREARSGESAKDFFERRGLLGMAKGYVAITVASLSDYSASVRLARGTASPVTAGRTPKVRHWALTLTPTRITKGRGWEIASLPLAGQ